jgi:hypothetical protein
MDNILRPILIRRSAQLPLLLIVAGVIGGLIAFGVIGLFVGPMILAVAYTLLGAWMEDEVSSTARPDDAAATWVAQYARRGDRFLEARQQARVRSFVHGDCGIGFRAESVLC